MGFGNRVRRTRGVRNGVVALAAGIGGMGLVAVSPTPAFATTVTPHQWIAKQYTELLGRAPTPAEHQSAVTAINNNCTTATVGALGISIATSTDFTNLYPDTTNLDKAHRLTALIRAAYNHDMNTSDWSGTYTAYTATPGSPGARTWAQTVTHVYTNIVFAGWVVPNICSTTTTGTGFGYQTPLDVRALTGPQASRTQAALQEDLDEAASGSTVFLDPGEVIRIGGAANGNKNLTIPDGVTLSTAGMPSRLADDDLAYARMGRIVPAGPDALTCYRDPATGNVTVLCNNVGLVSVGTGGGLNNVWVDGQGTSGSNSRMANIDVVGSTAASPTTIVDNRLSDPGRDGVGIRLRGKATSGVVCEQETVARNLVTGYASSHTFDAMGVPTSVDGIVVQCDGASVSANHVVDVTDSGILVASGFNRALAEDEDPVTVASMVQHSTVTGNTVVSAGQNAMVALGADAIGDCGTVDGGWLAPCLDPEYSAWPSNPFYTPQYFGTRSFSGASFDSNLFWTGSRTNFDIGLMVGGGARWGDHRILGTGVSFTNNTTGAVGARANVGIAVDNMLSATLTGNTSSFALVDGSPGQTWNKCPQAATALGAAADASVTGGSQSVATNTSIHGCLVPDGPATGLEWVKVNDTLDGFAGTASNRPIHMVGYNRVVNPLGALPADPGATWPSASGWSDLVKDFREMRLEGANFVRILVQFDQVVGPPTTGYPDGTPDPRGLAFLSNLATLAEQTGVWLDITGLGVERSYVVGGTFTAPWFESLTDAAWHRAQAVFWQATANQLKNRSSVGFYDIANEVVAAYKWPVSSPQSHTKWCGQNPATLSDTASCFVPTLSRSVAFPANPTPANLEAVTVPIAQAWTQLMHDAIRGTTTVNDPTHLITMGGISRNWGGFGPSDVAGLLDFIAPHLYPCSFSVSTCPTSYIDGQLTAAFADKIPGKPVIVEEASAYTGPGQFQYMLEHTQPTAKGWFFQYVEGKTPAQRGVTGATIGDALHLFDQQTLMRNTYAFQPLGPGGWPT